MLYNHIIKNLYFFFEMSNNIIFIEDPFFFRTIDENSEFDEELINKFNECLVEIIEEKKKGKEFEDNKCLMQFYLLTTYYLFCFYIIYVYIYLNIL